MGTLQFLVFNRGAIARGFNSLDACIAFLRLNTWYTCAEVVYCIPLLRWIPI